ncbi:MAG: acyltransferase [Verrucomicrobiota bacterium]|jgi:peptidoglycan/LPS O-acetylase OafA/YrhL
MWVILYHSRSDLWVGFYEIRKLPQAYKAFDRVVAWLSLPVACGGSAVMLFFVVSGFCVHLPYAANSRVFNITEYSLRRAFRILPPYLFAVLLTCLLEWLVYAMGGAAPTPWRLVGRVALLSQNYGIHAGQLLTNGSLWSLPVEVELYVAYLLFYYMLKSTSGRITAAFISIASLLATIGFLCGIQDLNENFLRFWAIWCGGALVAEWCKLGAMPSFKMWNGVSFAVLAMIAIWGESHQWHLGILAYLWAAVYFHLIWLALCKPESLYKFPGWCVRLGVGLGNISYSAYLIHYPLFAFYGFLWIRLAGHKPANFLVPLLFSISIWPVAWLFWKFCEYPFHRLSRQIAKRGI